MTSVSDSLGWFEQGVDQRKARLLDEPDPSTRVYVGRASFRMATEDEPRRSGANEETIIFSTLVGGRPSIEVITTGEASTADEGAAAGPDDIGPIVTGDRSRRRGWSAAALGTAIGAGAVALLAAAALSRLPGHRMAAAPPVAVESAATATEPPSSYAPIIEALPAGETATAPPPAVSLGVALDDGPRDDAGDRASDQDRVIVEAVPEMRAGKSPTPSRGRHVNEPTRMPARSRKQPPAAETSSGETAIATTAAPVRRLGRSPVGGPAHRPAVPPRPTAWVDPFANPPGRTQAKSDWVDPFAN